MKTLYDFTICCTEEQIRKAIELGAPIIPTGYYDFTGWDNDSIPKNSIIIGSKYYAIPTAAEMINWLEEQGIIVDTYLFIGYGVPEGFGFRIFNKGFRFDTCKYSTRKEATLAAIDAALVYLTNNKE